MANGNGNGNRSTVTWQALVGILWVVTLGLASAAWNSEKEKNALQDARIRALEQDWATLSLWRGEISSDVRTVRAIVERRWGDGGGARDRE